MSRKRLLVGSAALGGCAALGVLVLVTLLPEPPGVTYAHFQRVEVGMSQAEAEAVFGVPAGITAPNGRNWVGLYFL